MTEFRIPTSAGGITIEMRRGSDQVREVFVGEVLTVGLGASVEVIDQPENSTPTINGSDVVLDTPGRYRLRCGSETIRVLAMEPESLDRIPRQQSSGCIGGYRPDHERRGVLRSLAAYSDWNGKAVDLCRFNLTHFGV